MQRWAWYPGAEIQPPMSILFRYVEANQTIDAGMVWNFGARTSSGETFDSAAEVVGRKWNVCQTEQLVTFL